MIFFKKKETEKEKPNLLGAYRILPEEKLIIELYEGPLYLDKIIEHKKRLFTDPAFDNSYATVEDVRSCVFEVLISDSEKYHDFLDQHELINPIEGDRIWLTASDNQIVYMNSLKEKMANNFNNVNWVSSTKEALDLLGKTNLQSKVDAILNELKQEANKNS